MKERKRRTKERKDEWPEKRGSDSTERVGRGNSTDRREGRRGGKELADEETGEAGEFRQGGLTRGGESHSLVW